MTNAASTSNQCVTGNVNEAYTNPSHVIGPNFVTVKLSGKSQYNLWRIQMECLLKSQHMVDFIKGAENGKGKGKVGDRAMEASDSLVKGWILGSLSEDAARKAVNHLIHKQKNPDFTAKDLWDELERSYDPSAGSTLNPSFIVDVGEAYPYPSHVSAPNFVTVKLSGKDTYTVWVTQILCLLWSQHMVGFIEGEFPSPTGNGMGKVGDIDAWIASDSLVKGWILGSLSDGVAKKVVNRLKTTHKNTYFTAKDLWDQLQHSYGPSGHKQAADSLVKGWILGSLSEEAAGKVVNHLKHMQKNPDFTAKDLWDELQRSYGPSVRAQEAETELMTGQAESEIEVITESEDAKSKDEPTEEKTGKEMVDELMDNEYLRRRILFYIQEGNTRIVIDKLKANSLNPWVKIENNGNTVLHVAVRSSTKNHELLEKLLEMTPTEKTLLDVVNSDGSSLLHVAAIGGNIEAVRILVKKNPELLFAEDKEGYTPLAISISNMHKEMSNYLFDHIKENKQHGSYFSGKSLEELVVHAISCHDFCLAKKIINDDPDAIVDDSDAVLTALAQNFPRELSFWERKCQLDELLKTCKQALEKYPCLDWPRGCRLLCVIFYILFAGLCILTFCLCGFGMLLVQWFINDSSHVHKNARSLLFSVCLMISERYSSNNHMYYGKSIFEATRQNAYTFIRDIIAFFPDAIYSINVLDCKLDLAREWYGSF